MNATVIGPLQNGFDRKCSDIKLDGVITGNCTDFLKDVLDVFGIIAYMPCEKVNISCSTSLILKNDMKKQTALEDKIMRESGYRNPVEQSLDHVVYLDIVVGLLLFHRKVPEP